jgi:hypothetical protein
MNWNPNAGLMEEFMDPFCQFIWPILDVRSQLCFMSTCQQLRKHLVPDTAQLRKHAVCVLQQRLVRKCNNTQSPLYITHVIGMDPPIPWFTYELSSLFRAEWDAFNSLTIDAIDYGCHFSEIKGITFDGMLQNADSYVKLDWYKRAEAITVQLTDAMTEAEQADIMRGMEHILTLGEPMSEASATYERDERADYAEQMKDERWRLREELQYRDLDKADTEDELAMRQVSIF